MHWVSQHLMHCFMSDLLVAVSEHELIWANGEDNPNFFTLFGKLSELRWMCNNATECMAKKVSCQPY